MNKKHQAFTLVEMMVSLAIIAILLALLLPALGAAREASRKSACQNNLRQLGVAFQNHLQTEPLIPVMWSYEYLPHLELENLARESEDVLATKKPRIFRCPSDRHADLFDKRMASSYGLNFYIAGEPLNRIIDGLANTVAFGELGPERDDDWTSSPGFQGVFTEGPHGDGRMVVFCDGHVGFVAASSLGEDTGLYLVLPDDGNVIDPAELGW